jgi:hypothetical protein
MKITTIIMLTTSLHASELVVSNMGYCLAQQARDEKPSDAHSSTIGQDLWDVLTSFLWGDRLPKKGAADGSTNTDLHKERGQGKILIGLRY